MQARRWAKEAKDIMAERTELQGIFEKHKLSLADFDAQEFHTHKKSKLTDDDARLLRAGHACPRQVASCAGTHDQGGGEVS